MNIFHKLGQYVFIITLLVSQKKKIHIEMKSTQKLRKYGWIFWILKVSTTDQDDVN